MSARERSRHIPKTRRVLSSERILIQVRRLGSDKDGWSQVSVDVCLMSELDDGIVSTWRMPPWL